MVHDTAYITYRGTQNPDTPDLPFAQSYPIHTEADIPINFGQSLALASLTRSRPRPPPPKPPITTGGGSTGGDYDTDITRLYRIHKEQEGRITDAYKHRLSIETKLLALQNRPSGSGFTKSQIEKIFKDYYGDDIKRLDRIHKEQEGRITSGYEHRLSIEGKVEKNILAFPDIHTKLTDLGTAVSDVSSGLESHKLEDIGGDLLGGLLGGGMVGLAVIGVGAYFLLRRKK